MFNRLRSSGMGPPLYELLYKLMCTHADVFQLPQSQQPLNSQKIFGFGGRDQSTLDDIASKLPVTFDQMATSVGSDCPTVMASHVGIHGNCNDVISTNFTCSRWEIDNNDFHELCQLSCSGEISPLAFPMLHLASNNLLFQSQALNVVQFILQDDNRSVHNALIAEQSPPAKAIARTLLPSAIDSQDVRLIRSLLDTGIDLESAVNYQHHRPLQLAASKGGVAVVQLLLHHGALVNYSDTTLCPPLTTAAKIGSFRLVELFLDAGADVNAMGTTETALQAAAMKGDFDIAQLLIDAGADVNATSPWTSSALQKAVMSKNVALVQILISRGADTNAPNGAQKYTALQLAASENDQVLVDLLLTHGALDIIPSMLAASRRGHFKIVESLFRFGKALNVSSHGACESAALHAGIRCGEIAFVRKLLESGVPVNAMGIEDAIHWTTGLELAVLGGNLGLVQLLISSGADVNAPAVGISGQTALQTAASTGNVQLLRLLLCAGADVNAASYGISKTALTSAAAANNLEMVQLLLAYGADITEQRNAVLKNAIQKRSSLELVRFLLELGVEKGFRYCEMLAWEPGTDPNVELIQLLLDFDVLEKSHTLIGAIFKSDLALVELLLRFGADVNAVPLYDSCPYALGYAARFGSLEVMQLLLEHGANSQEKARALQAVAQDGMLEAARLLLMSGADVNAAPLKMACFDNLRRTALQAAAGTRNIKLVRLLLEAGADVESKNRSEHEEGTALQFAAIAGSISIASELIQRGADVNAPSIGEHGRTAIEGAAEHGRLDMVQLLINLQADVPGSRAVGLARNEGHDGVVQLLLEHGFEDIRVDADVRRTWSLRW